MFNPSGSEITEELGSMFISERAAGFQFDDQPLCHEQVSEVIAKDRAVDILNLQGMLLDHSQIFRAETMGETIFVHLLQMTVTQESVKLETGFTDKVAKSKYAFIHPRFSARLAPLRGLNPGHKPYFSSRR